MADRLDGYDDEFDYAGKDLVAPPRYLRGMGGRTVRGYVGTSAGNQKLGRATDAVMAGLQARFGGASSRMARAMRVWRTMGDQRLRSHAQGIYLRQNRVTRELVVYVDASVWLHEFQMRSVAYLQEWNHRCQGAGLDMQANKMTFRLSSVARAAGQNGTLTGSLGAGDRAGVSSVPLSGEERAYVERSVAVISNERLRKAAYDAMKSVMERDKGLESQKTQNGA